MEPDGTSQRTPLFAIDCPHNDNSNATKRSSAGTTMVERLFAILVVSDRSSIDPFQFHMMFDLDLGLPMEDLALEGWANAWDWKDANGHDHISQQGTTIIIFEPTGKRKPFQSYNKFCCAFQSYNKFWIFNNSLHRSVLSGTTTMRRLQLPRLVRHRRRRRRRRHRV